MINKTCFNRIELILQMRKVNPHMKFSKEHMTSIVSEVFNMYGPTGLPFSGLLATYKADDDAAQGNIDHDLQVLHCLHCLLCLLCLLCTGPAGAVTVKRLHS